MKGAPISVATGELAGERFRIDTPQPSRPEAVAEVAKQIVNHHRWDGEVGMCMPSVVQHGVIGSAANIDDSWVGVDGDALFTEVIGRPVTLINDADAAGIAEMRWGNGRGRDGVVICLTFGTGIGSGFFVDGKLVPNSELGHLELDGYNAESRASARAREQDDLSWKDWAKRVNHYLEHVVFLFSPELLILGGGVSKRPEKWFDRLDVDCELKVAKFANNAGIAGAAIGESIVGPA